MTKRPFITDLHRWARAGNGQELQFFATDVDVQGWLQSCLPDEFSPYFLVGDDLVNLARKSYARVPFRLGLQDFPACAYPKIGSRYNFWLLSERLSPGLKLIPSDLNSTQRDSMDSLCSLNGLILLQHGLRVKAPHLDPNTRYQDSSRIAMLDHIQNQDTGEVQRIDTYRPIYDGLCKAIKKDLVYCTVYRFPNGQEEEDCHIRLMTERAAGSYRDGVPFLCAPGRRLHESTLT